MTKGPTSPEENKVNRTVLKGKKGQEDEIIDLRAKATATAGKDHPMVKIGKMKQGEEFQAHPKLIKHFEELGYLDGNNLDDLDDDHKF